MRYTGWNQQPKFFDGPMQRAIHSLQDKMDYYDDLREDVKVCKRAGVNRGNFSTWMTTGKGLSMEKCIQVLGVFGLHVRLNATTGRMITEVVDEKGKVVQSDQANLFEQDQAIPEPKAKAKKKAKAKTKKKKAKGDSEKAALSPLEKARAALRKQRLSSRTALKIAVRKGKKKA